MKGKQRAAQGVTSWYWNLLHT